MCLSVYLLVCLLEYLFAVFLCCHLECFCISNFFHVKWQNEIVIHFVEGHLSSLNLMTFCQVFYGDYWSPYSFFPSSFLIQYLVKHISLRKVYSIASLFNIKRFAVIMKCQISTAKIQRNGWWKITIFKDDKDVNNQS